MSLLNISLTFQKQKNPISELLGQKEDKTTHFWAKNIQPDHSTLK